MRGEKAAGSGCRLGVSGVEDVGNGVNSDVRQTTKPMRGEAVAACCGTAGSRLEGRIPQRGSVHWSRTVGAEKSVQRLGGRGQRELMDGCGMKEGRKQGSGRRPQGREKRRRGSEARCGKPGACRWVHVMSSESNKPQGRTNLSKWSTLVASKRQVERREAATA